MKKKNKLNNILVTGAGSLIAQGVIKCIKKFSKSFKIIGSDYFELSIGFLWCDKSYLIPDILNPKISEKVWLETFLKIIKKEKIDLIIPCADFEIPLFSKYKQNIEKNTNSKVLVSDKHIVNMCNDKYLTKKFLDELEIDYPSTYNYKEFKKLTKKPKYPLVVKPRKGSTSKGLHIVRNSEELKKIINNNPDLIIQEYLVGEEYTCGSVYMNNKVISVISLRRTLKNGNTSVAFSEKNNVIDKFIYNITKKIKPFGPMNFQLKFTKNGPRIFEINPRFSGTTPIRELFGLNEIKGIFLNLNKENQFKYKIKKGIIMRYFEDIFVDNKIKKIKKL